MRRGAARAQPQPLRPLPDLPELLTLRAAAQGLRLPAHGGAHAARQGPHASAQRGRGVEFQEVRAYVPGDDPRSIDWRVTARRGRPHTKLFREERERPVWLLVDLDPLMFFGTRGQLKCALAVRAAALLAWVAALGADRIGAVIVGGGSAPGAGPAGLRIVPPRAREAAVPPLLDTLLTMQPVAPAAHRRGGAPPDAAGARGAGGLHAALRALAALARPGSIVLAISDFAALDEPLQTHFATLGVGRECRFYWITDALEEQALPDGRFRAGLPGQVRTLDGASLRSRWLAAWREREARLRQLAQRLAAPIVRLDTRETVQDALRPLLQGRISAA
ncbi:MAG TPA: DUF58 domain-containing protein [Steroidobacteraceae bacterium]|nr:DUF58 domain-containing protein [Steroidobacteraceae bacterium]